MTWKWQWERKKVWAIRKEEEVRLCWGAWNRRGVRPANKLELQSGEGLVEKTSWQPWTELSSAKWTGRRLDSLTVFKDVFLPTWTSLKRTTLLLLRHVHRLKIRSFGSGHNGSSNSVFRNFQGKCPWVSVYYLLEDVCSPFRKPDFGVSCSRLLRRPAGRVNGFPLTPSFIDSLIHPCSQQVFTESPPWASSGSPAVRDLSGTWRDCMEEVMAISEMNALEQGASRSEEGRAGNGY